MPSMIFRLLLCLSSYFPLMVIFAVQFFYKGKRIGGIFFLLIGVISLIGIYVYLHYSSKLNPIKIKVQTVQRRDGEAMSYIVTYLLPFIVLPIDDTASCISLWIILGVLIILYMNSDMMHINPMLNIFGFHVYEITLVDGEIRTLISTRRARKGREVNVIQMSEDIIMEI